MVSKEARERLGAEYRRGIELFNAEQFFECHEVLEEVWRAAAEKDRFFLQSLIHFAVGFYHYQRGNPDGATRQLRKALRKLAGYLPKYGGIETGRLCRDAIAAMEAVSSPRRIEGFPRIDLVSVPARRQAH